MDFSVEPLLSSEKEKRSISKTVSFSVDCDGIAHYLNFAPIGTRLNNDKYTFPIMCRTLLSLFEEFKIKATFFCIASQLHSSVNLEVYKEIVSAGHQIGNHTLNHLDIASLENEKEHLREIENAHNLIKKLLGVEPVGYRAPAYFISSKGLLKLAQLGYLYDSSVSNSKLTKTLLSILSFFNSSLQFKKHSTLHNRFPGNGPYLIQFNERGKRLIEWPIPKSLGLSFYGTLHCSFPSFFFNLQTFYLNFLSHHIHYELHPIEILPPECLKDHPWLSNIPFTQRGDLREWLKKRLKKLTQNKSIITLEELSASYLHILHNGA